ncbi:hypothetical protein SE17_04720 [Kouleothrix aurantiaca]|uniref:HTH araC/xylS-type domain-containing protein n=1 Tax=Kouleothrix aurantiaca TaxID=186479 RepID=A0A0P9D963_9CHLR|nr:hypothetical protein SE17_04720 [Kouleothrix aurantiaca]
MTIVSHELFASVFDRLHVAQPHAYSYQTLATSTNRDWQYVSMYEGAVVAMPEGSIVDESLRYGAYCMNMTVSGELVLGARYDGTAHQDWTGPGYFSMLPPIGQVHWTSTAPGQVYHLFLSPQLVEAIAAELYHGDPACVGLPFLFNRHDALVEQICWAMRQELYHPAPASRLYVETLAQSLVTHLLRHHAPAQPPLMRPAPQLRPAAIRAVCEYIEAHLEQPLGLAELAQVASSSIATLARQFKLATGLSPHQYVVRRRLERARALLQEGAGSVSQVAYATGFADHSHLVRSFQRYYGLRPGDLLPAKKKIHVVGTNIQDLTDPRMAE